MTRNSDFKVEISLLHILSFPEANFQTLLRIQSRERKGGKQQHNNEYEIGTKKKKS